MTDDPDLAAEILLSLEQGRQIPLLTARRGGLSLDRAYRLSAQIQDRRVRRGERAVGRKIGFTNKTIWTEYNVSAPIFGPMYDSTVRPLGAPVKTGALLEPRIEPEIAFRLSSTPEPGMAPEDLIKCISGVCAGFELVQSIFAGWKFEAADTVAAFGLHGAFLHGPVADVAPAERKDWVSTLSRFRTTLRRNGEIAATGDAGHVLGGGPLVALGYLTELVSRVPDAIPLKEGEIVTTGTLTRALPIGPGETWHASLSGLPLDAIEIELI